MRWYCARGQHAVVLVGGRLPAVSHTTSPRVSVGKDGTIRPLPAEGDTETERVLAARPHVTEPSVKGRTWICSRPAARLQRPHSAPLPRCVSCSSWLYMVQLTRCVDSFSSLHMSHLALDLGGAAPISHAPLNSSCSQNGTPEEPWPAASALKANWIIAA